MKKVILTRVIGTVNPSKVTIEVAAEKSRPNTQTNLAGLLNESDDRFNKPALRYGHMTVGVAELKKYFDIDASGLKAKQAIEVGMENPTLNGHPITVQLTETTVPSKADESLAVQDRYGLKRLETENGNYVFLEKGTNKPVYQYAKIVIASECKDTYLELTQVPKESVIADAIAETNKMLDKPAF